MGDPPKMEKRFSGFEGVVVVTVMINSTWREGIMRKVIVCIAGVALLTLSGTFARAGMYAGINGGAINATDTDVSYTAEFANSPDVTGEGEVTWDVGYWFSGFVGYGLDNLPVRLEGEVFYQGHDADTSTAYGVTGVARGERASYGLLANVYYDFINDSRLTPFVGAGIGASRVEVTDVTDNFKSVKDVVFAWQIGGGLAYAITDRVSADLKYRYYRTSDISDRVPDSYDSGDFLSQDIENSAHVILFGIRVAL